MRSIRFARLLFALLAIMAFLASTSSAQNRQDLITKDRLDQGYQRTEGQQLLHVDNKTGAVSTSALQQGFLSPGTLANLLYDNPEVLGSNIVVTLVSGRTYIMPEQASLLADVLAWGNLSKIAPLDETEVISAALVVNIRLQDRTDFTFTGVIFEGKLITTYSDFAKALGEIQYRLRLVGQATVAANRAEILAGVAKSFWETSPPPSPPIAN